MRSAFFKRTLVASLLGAFAWASQAQFTFTHIGGGATGSLLTNGPGSYTLEGGGNDIWSANDEFDYAQFTAAGDFDVRVRVESLEYTANWTKAGIMARETLTGNSRMAFSRVTPPPPGVLDTHFAYRTGTSAGTQGEHEDGAFTPAYPNAWVRLAKTGPNIESFASANGDEWTSLGIQNTTTWEGGAFAATFSLGLAVSRHSGEDPLAVAQFRNFGISPLQITAQPTNQTNSIGLTATFSVGVAGDFTSIQWRKNGVPISGATSRNYTTPALVAGDSGSLYSAVVSNLINRTSVTSAVVTLTASANPSVTDASSRFDGRNTNVYIQFSKDMDPVTTLNIANYALTNVGGPTPLLSPGNPVVGVAATAGSSSSTLSTVGTTGGVNNYPAAESPPMAIDGSGTTKYLNFAMVNVGLIVTRSAGAAIPQAFRMSAANDAPDRDPVTITIEGTTAADPTAAATSATWTLLYNGPSGLATDPGRNASGPQIAIANSTAFNTYRILVTAVRNPAQGIMQFSEVQLLNVTGGAGAPVAVGSAQFHNGNPQLVRLGIPSGLVAGSSYIVRVSGVQDTGALVLIPNPTIRNFVHLQGINAPAGLTVKIWNGANTIALVKSSIASCAVPTFTTSTINVGMEYTTSERGTIAEGNTFLQGNTENYGTWIYGQFVPPTTGNYQFALSSDDLGELWLSTDANPANKVLLTSQGAWNGYRGYISGAGNPPPPLPAPVALVAGRSYYLETIVAEGGGGDHVSIAVRKPGDAAIADGQLPIPREMFSTNFTIGCPPTSFFRTVGPITISAQPVSQTAFELANATFLLGLDGSPNVGGGYSVQWYSNNVAVANATNAVFVFPTIRYANGAQYFAIANNSFSSVTSSVATLTVTSDTIAPLMLSAAGSGSFTNVTIAFNEAVNVASGTIAANYTITNNAGVPLAVLSASIRDNTNVVLRTAPQTQGARYTVVVNNVGDRAGVSNPILPNSIVRFTAWIFTPGYALMEVYPTGLENTPVGTVTNHPTYPYYPSERYYLTHLDSRDAYPNDTHERYGGRISGLFIPPAPSFTVYLRSDDASRLQVNPAGDNPSADSLVTLTEETGCCGAFSAHQAPVSGLTAGNRYYYEVIWKEGTGGDYAQVSVDGINVVPGDFLGVYANPDLANLQITQVPRDTTNEVGFVAHLSVVATANLTLTYQWYSNGVAIAGARASQYTTAEAKLADNGTIYSVVTIVPGGVATNSAVFRVVPDTHPPTMARVTTDGSFRTIFLNYSEPIQEGPAIEASNYALTGPGGPNVSSVEWRGSNVVLHLDSAMVPNSTYSLDITAVFDRAGNASVTDPLTVQVKSWVFGYGFARFDAYLNLIVPDANNVAPLVAAINAGPSTFHFFTNQVNWPQSFGAAPGYELYGMRFSGLFRAPETGNYKFEPAHDDATRITFSSDANPSNIVATFDEVCCNGFAVGEAGLTVTLTAGNLYYFEQLTIEGGGGDYSGLSVTLPSGAYIAPIPAQYLVSTIDPIEATGNNANFSVQPVAQTIIQNTKATFSGAVTNAGPSGVFYQWQVNAGSGFTDIIGANSTTYTTPFQALANNGNIYRLQATVPGRTLFSSNAVLNILVDTVRPTVLSARAITPTQIELVFSEQINGGTASENSNFQVQSSTGPITVTSSSIGSDTTRALLNLSSPMPPGYVTVTIFGVADLVNLEILPGSQISFINYQPLGLLHRYNFNNVASGNAAGATIIDSLGTANGTVLGAGAALTGTRLTLPGGASATAAYVDLPNRLLSSISASNGGSGKLTVEGWVKVTSAAQSWARIFDFGNATTGELNGPGGGGDGADYFFYSGTVANNGALHQLEVRDIDPQPTGFTPNVSTSVQEPSTNLNSDMYFVITWDEASGKLRAFENGEEKPSLYSPVSMNQINDVNVWLGRSQWSGDANLQGEYDEFRMYNRILSSNEMAFNRVSGADYNFGSPLAVRLSVPNTQMYLGATQQASVFADFASISNVNLTLSRSFGLVSSSPSVVNVNPSGLLTAGTAGTAALRASFNGVTSAVVNVSAIVDTVGPVLLSATADGSFNTITLVFNEPLNPLSATEPSFYNLSGAGSPQVTSVTRNGSTIVLRTSPALQPGGIYALDIFFQTDLLGNSTNPDPLSTTVRALGINNGFVRFEAYLDLNNPDGNNFAPFLNALNSGVPPSFSFYTNQVNWPQSNPNVEHYGMRFTGLFRAPTTGSYKFEPAHDDAVIVNFSTDATPANKTTIYSGGCCSGFGSGEPGGTVNLVAGNLYYMELLVNEAGGGDYAGLSVTLPSGQYIAPITAQYLASAVDPTGASIVITQNPTNRTFAIGSGSNTTFTVAATAVNPTEGTNAVRFYQWYRNNGAGFVVIPGANSASYSLPFPCIGDNGAQFRAEINILGATRLSSAATLTVTGQRTLTVNSATNCAGGSSVLIATSDAVNPTYLWTPGGQTTARVTNSPSSTTTYTVAVTDGPSTCVYNAQGIITVRPLPTTTISVTGASCPGSTVVLTTTTSATNATYLWTPGGQTTASVTNTPNQTTTYTVLVTDGVTGCSATAAVTVAGPNTYVGSAPITITDNSGASPYPSTINVSGLTSLVCKVTVTLSNLNHGWPDDIDVLLVSPSGQKVMLMSDAGGGFAISNVVLKFDDSATAVLADQTLITSGTYRPSRLSNYDTKPDIFPSPAPGEPYASTLDAFNFTNPNGAWSLYIVDDETGDSGSIANGWSLSISGQEPFADVAIASLDAPDPVAVGSNLTYTVLVTNRGPANALNVSVVDTRPLNANYVSAVSTLGSCSNSAGVVTCTLGTMTPGAVATITIVVVPTAAVTLDNTATVSSSTTDIDLSNNVTIQTTTVLTPAVITTPPANQVVCAGATATFSVVATGGSIGYQWFSNGVAIASATGPSLTLVNAQPSFTAAYSVRVSNGASTVNASANLTVNPQPTLTISGATTICPDGTTVLTASTSAANPLYLWSPGGQTTAGITVQPAATTTYTVRVTDGVTGCTNVASTTVIIVAPTTYANVNPISINSTGSSPFPSTITVSGQTSLVCKVSVTLSNLTHTWPDDINILLVSPSGQQKVLLMSDAGGGNSINNVVLKFDDAAASLLPDETLITSGTYRPSNFDNKVEVFPPAAPYSSVLAAFNGIDPNGVWSLYVLDDQAGDTGTLVNGWSLSIAGAVPFTDLSITSVATPPAVIAGSNATFTVTVTNRGPANALNVSVVDTLPSNATYVSTVSSQGSCSNAAGIVTCALGTLSPGNIATITVVVTTTGTGSVTNAATVSTSTTELQLANNSTSSSAGAFNRIVITTPPVTQTACVGGTVTFSVVVTGDSPVYSWSSNGVPIASAIGSSLVLANVQVASSAAYSVLVSNAVSSAFATANLTVNPLPSVAVSGAATNCPGIAVVLTATTGAANPSYLWTPGGQTTASVTVSPLTTTTYSVRVTDGTTGCTNTGTATITVIPGTTLTAIGNKTNCIGGPVSFTTTASGTGPFSYVWRRGTTLVQGPDTNNTFTIAAITAGDLGAYSVEVTGGCNSATNTGNVVLPVVPTITAQPQDQTTPMGNGAVFSVTATTSAGTLSYQWSTNGVLLPGSTASSLAISNLTLADNGRTFSVIVSNCGGTTASAVATLFVVPTTGISFDFNTPGQYTNAPYHLTGNNWMDNAIPTTIAVPLNPLQVVIPYESATGGVGIATGGGGLDFMMSNTVDRAMTLLPVRFDFSLPGKTLIASVMAKIKAPLTSGRRAIQMAFVTTTNTGNNAWVQVNNNDGQGFMSAILNSAAAGAPPTYHLRSQGKSVAGAGAVEQIPVNSPSNTLVAGNWYRFVAKFVNVKATTAGSYTVESYVQDMGVDGLTPGATVLAMAPNTVANDMVDQKSLLFAIRGFEDGGIDYYDNIAIATRSGPAAFVTSAQSQTILENRKARFRALVDGDGPYSYQWNSNGVPIAGASQWDYTTPPLGLGVSGAAYTVSVTTTNGTITSGAGIVTVTAEPLNVASIGSVDGSIVGLRFDQAVDKATAQTAANYTINGTPAIAAQLRDFTAESPRGIDQKLRTNLTEVLLTPAAPISGSITVSVANVKSLSGVTILAGNNSATGLVAGLTGLDIDPISQVNGQASPVPGYNYSFAPGQFEVAGGGFDIFGSFDSFRFVYQKVTGDFDIKVHIPYLDMLRNAGKGGFDARISLDAYSPHVGAYPNPALPGRNFMEGGIRPDWNAATVAWGSQPVISYPNVWLRFRRSGNTFIRYSSTNGVNWVNDGVTTPATPFPATLYVGFAVDANVGGTVVQQLVTAQYDNYGNFGGYPGATIAITTQPASSTTTPQSSVTLSVTATAGGGLPAGEIAYLWQRTNALSGGWTNLLGAGSTANTLATGPLLFTDSGAQYRVILSAPGALSVTSSVATITITDTAAPTITAAAPASGNAKVIVINFNEAVTAATGLNPANYNIAGGAAIASINFLNGDARAVIITLVNPQIGTFDVVVTGVRDLNNNLIASATRTLTNAQIPITGPIITEHYGGLATAANIGDLTNDVKFTTGTPDWISYSNIWFGVNAGTGAIQTGPDNYGTKTYAYFVAPTNGAYKFYLRGDDFLHFFFNTNSDPALSTSPTGKVLQINMTVNLAAYSAANSWTSPPLNAGQAYYMEVLMKEGGGGDGMSVALRPPTDTAIPGQAETISASFFRYPAAIAPDLKSVIELYNGDTGNDLVSLSNVIRTFAYTNRQPDISAYGKQLSVNMELDNSGRDNYLGKMFSYLVPPSNGVYKFWIRSDDASSLRLNTNSNPALSTDPAGAVRISELNVFTAAYTLNASAQNISLNGGQRYYIEGLWKEGIGGDGMYIAMRAQSDAATPALTDTINTNHLAFPTNLFAVTPNVFAAIAPINPTVSEGQRVRFTASTVGGTAGSTWFKNGQQVWFGGTAFNTDPLTLADNGAVFSYFLSNSFSVYTATSRVTVLADTAAPILTNAVASQFGDSVLLSFNELLDPTTAGFLSNYRINGLTVLGVDLDETRGNRVSLRTAPQTPNVNYTLTVNGVRDLSVAGNPIVNATTNFTAWGFGGLGAVYVEIFTNIPGGQLENLLQDPRYIANLPDMTYYTNAFVVGNYSAAPNGGDTGLNNYGARMTGLYSPPTNGLYRFFIRSDDGSRLYMNTNGPSPAGRVMIARQDGANPGAYNTGPGLGYLGANASPILSLSAGTAYYLEGLMKEGGGGDYMVVTVKPVDATTLTEIGGVGAPALGDQISGVYFGVPGNPDLYKIIVLSTPPPVLNLFESAAVNLDVVATATPASILAYLSYQWQKTNAGLGTFSNIPGATGPSLSFFASLADNNMHYRLIASIPGTTIIAASTQLKVVVDNVPPYIASVSSLDGTTIGVSWDGPIDPGAAVEPTNFSVNEGAVNITSSVLRPGFPNKMLLTLDAPIVGTFKVECFFMQDLASVPNATGYAAATGIVQQLTAKNIYAVDGTGTNAGSFNALLPGFTWTDTNGGFDISANGRDIWEAADGMNFTYRPVTGDFDIKVRVNKLIGADQWSKAGLMARASTNAASRNVYMAAAPVVTTLPGQAPINRHTFQWRDIDGGASASVAGTIPVPYPTAWLRLQRSNSVFYGYAASNNVNWVLLSSRNMGTNFPDTLQVGMATTSHDQTRLLANNAYAEYRQLQFPPSAVITQQPVPALITVGLHQTVTFSNLVATGTGLRYQWRNNGVPILNATNANITIANTQVSDSGTYTAVASTDGGGQVSAGVVLVVTNALPNPGTDSITATQNIARTITTTNLLANDTDAEGDPVSLVWVSGVAPVTYVANFNDGLSPTGATIYNAAGLGASVKPNAGVGDSPYLEINPNIASAGGSMVINELTLGKRVSAWTATFALKIFPASAEPADGFTLSFGNDIADGPTTAYAAENGGTATGFAFCVDNYRFTPLALGAAANAPGGGDANTSGLKINYKNVIVAGVKIPAAWNVDRWVPVSITVTESGSCTVLVDGTNVFGTFTLPNYTPTRGRFGIFGRTGGATMATAVDDININVRTVDTALESSFNAGAGLYGTAAVSGGFLHLTDAANGQAGALILNELTPGVPVTSFNAAMKIRIGNGTGNAADGMSFNFANDLPIAATGPNAAEEGMGTGLSIGIDNYPTGGPDSPSFKIKFGGTNLVTPILTAKWGNVNFIPVNISLALNGRLTVTVDGTNVVTNLQTPYVPAVGRFGLYARTGGENETHWVDDLVITATTAGASGSFSNDFNATYGSGTVVITNGVITYTPAPNSGCTSDSFYYLASDGQLNGTSLGRVNVSLVDGSAIAPTITVCATNRTIPGVGAQTPLPSLVGEVIATDTCGVPTITQSPAAGTLVNAGPTVVTITATDPSGLFVTCQATVTVQGGNSLAFIPSSAVYNKIAGTFSASFATANGVSYRIEYKNTLNDTWLLLTTISGNGAVRSFIDAGPLPAGSRFYRIVPQ